MKRFLSFLLKLLSSILFTLILIEIGLRLIPGVIPLDLLVRFHEDPRTQIARTLGLPAKDDTDVLIRDDGGPELRIFKPYTRIVYRVWEKQEIRNVVMDEVGFCNPPGTYQRKTIDIITIGDSFTYCHAVYPQDTWASQLGALTGHTAYNLGRGGVGVHEYLQILKEFGLEKDPKVVILNIYEGNDLRDARRYYKYLEDQKNSELEQEPAPPTSVDSYSLIKASLNLATEEVLLRRSYAINLTLALTELGQEYLLRRFGGADALTDEESFKYNLVFPGNVVIPFNPYDTDKDEVKYAKLLKENQIEIEVRIAMLKALEEFVALARMHDFIPVVTYMPSAHIAYEQNVIFENPELTKLMPWFSQEQRDFIREQSQTLNFVFVDLTPGLQASAQLHGPDDLLYLRSSLHLSMQGHIVIAEILSKKLQELQIIDSQPVN